MRMSTKGRCGLRMMVELAAHHGNGPVLVETIVKVLAVRNGRTVRPIAARQEAREIEP